jgi:hypothetical protein
MDLNTNVRVGYCLLDTTKIPNISKKTKVDNSNCRDLRNIYIKSEIPIDLEIGGGPFILSAGEHFIPTIFLSFHSVLIKTDFLNNDKIEVYTHCYEDDNYRNATYYLARYPLFIETIKCKKTNRNAVFKSGMAGNLTVDELIDYKNNLTNICEDCVYINKKAVLDGAKQSTISDFIYHNDILDVQKDEEITNLLVDYDRGGFIRLSNPPCIWVQYKPENYKTLKKILNSKYNIDLKEKQPGKVYIVRSYNDMLSQLVKHNEKIDLYEKTGVFKFVSLKEYPFTLEIYNENYKAFEDSPVIICCTNPFG